MTTTTETLDKLVDELDLGKGTDLFGKDGLVLRSRPNGRNLPFWLQLP